MSREFVLDSSTVKSCAYDSSKPLLLFISPVIPSDGGNGTAVRAYLELDALARSYNVALCVVTMYDLLPIFADTGHLSKKCVEVTVVSGKTPPESLYPILSTQGRTDWDVIHVFRMSMIPHGLRVAEARCAERGGARPYMCLDMDDYESKKAVREASLYVLRGDQKTAAEIKYWAQLCMRGEAAALAKFDRVYLSNPSDVREMSERYNCNKLRHLPNATCIQNTTSKRNRETGSASILFVGTMNYYPNEDGVLFFCREILPVLRTELSGALTFTIVGMYPSPTIRQLSQDYPDIKVEADVPSVGPYYEAADLAIVPLRLGGGTRMKILEAMSFGVPVVSTRLGADGLLLESGNQILIAESSKDFATHCVSVLQDHSLGERLASEARRWLLANHTVDNMASVMSAEQVGAQCSA